MNSLEPIGWREWVALPEFDVPWTKAKIDTGARTSSLHAEEIEVHGERVQFTITPWQGSELDSVRVDADVLEWRIVRSSSGYAEERPTILTDIIIRSRSLPIELTLTQRHQMGFRMLVGREAIRTTFLVDPSRSYLGARPPKELRKRNRVSDEDE